MVGLENDTTSDYVGGYIDRTGDTAADEIAIKLNKGLKERIPAVLSEDNGEQYTLEWKGRPIDSEPVDLQHEIYLERFCEKFKQDIMRLLYDVVEDVEDELWQRKQQLFHEVLHHARFAEIKCELFCGRKKELQMIKTYIVDGCSHCPFLVYGRSGIGKTALLAWVAKQSTEWLNGNCTVLLRFLGTSPHSSNICDVLKSMILQLCLDRGYNLPAEEQLENIGDVRRLFWDVLVRASQDGRDTRPVVIVLDSCDQLSLIDGAHRMSWLPKHLPKNVRIVVSMLSDRFDCYSNMTKRFTDHRQRIGLEDLSDETACLIIGKFLQQHGRCITKDQHDLVVESFRGSRRPLYLRLILDSARRWQSYMPLSQVMIADTIHGAITKLFENIEVKFGNTFVRHALGYLTCGRGGLTDLEMEDALSCDDEVLNTVYQYHDPPLEGVIRIPSLLWARIQHGLKDYLAQRQVDGKVVHAWYHRQFWEAAEKRYLCDEAEAKARHRTLAEIFLQDNGIQRTIVLEQRGNKRIESADRCVTHQQLSARNPRKLNSLPYHLLRAGEVDMLREHCLLHFEFLLIQMLAFNVGYVSKLFKEMCEAPELQEYQDIRVYRDFLFLCFDSLWQDPFLLAYHLKGRLGPYVASCDMPLLLQLVQGAEAWLQSASIPLLLPSHPLSLPSPDSPLKFSILVGYDGHVAPNGEMVVCHWTERPAGEKLQVLDLATKSMVASIDIQAKLPFVISSNSQQIMFCDSALVYIIEMDGGEITRQFAYHDNNNKFERVIVRCVALNEANTHLAVCVRCQKPRHRGPLQTAVYLYLIDVKQLKVIGSANLGKNKPLDHMYFIDQDRKIAALAKDRIVFMDAKTLTKLNETPCLPDVQSSLAKVVSSKDTLMVPVAYKTEVCLHMFNFTSCSSDKSNNIHFTNAEKLHMFGLDVIDNGSLVVGGTYAAGSANTANICIWKPSDSTYQHIGLTSMNMKGPRVLAVSSQGESALVGWTSGHITVVDLLERKELWTFQGHSQPINSMRFLGRSHLLSIAQDHSLKVWDALRLTDIARSNNKTNNNTCGCSENVSEVFKQPEPGTLPTQLDSSTQCLDVCVGQGVVITAPPEPEISPRLWHLNNGDLDIDTTVEIQKAYEQSIKDHEVIFQGNTHAAVQVLSGGAMIYNRFRRDHLTSFIIHPSTPSDTLAHVQITNAYLCLVVPAHIVCHNTDGSCSQKLAVVRDKELHLYALPQMEKVQDIPMPSLIRDVVNTSSSKGFRRLCRYRAGFTCDGRYFVLVNAGGTYGKPHKFFDLVDLPNEKYLSRHVMSSLVPMTVMKDSFTYLVKTVSNDYRIYAPSKLAKTVGTETFVYRSAIATGQFISRDGTLGLEFDNRSHTVNLWRICNLQKLHTFTGHVHTITSCDISTDNAYVVTGSYDKTVRVWCAQKGKQLCLFHMNDPVDDVKFNQMGSYVVVHCYSAPQRKQAVILRMHNMKGMRKFMRYISRYDICRWYLVVPHFLLYIRPGWLDGLAPNRPIAWLVNW